MTSTATTSTIVLNANMIKEIAAIGNNYFKLYIECIRVLDLTLGRKKQDDDYVYGHFCIF